MSCCAGFTCAIFVIVGMHVLALLVSSVVQFWYVVMGPGRCALCFAVILTGLTICFSGIWCLGWRVQMSCCLAAGNAGLAGCVRLVLPELDGPLWFSTQAFQHKQVCTERCAPYIHVVLVLLLL